MCANEDEDNDEQRGILTESDIEFLKGSETPNSTEQQARARQRIRERVAATMRDFEILLEHWPEEQQRQTLDLIDDQEEKSVEELGADMIAFLYMIVNSGNTRSEIVLDENPDQKLLRFRSSLNRGIRKGNLAFGNSPGVVSVATTTSLYETPDPEAVREEVSSEVLTDAHRKLNQKYRESEFYEDDGIIIEDRETAVKDLFLEWEELVTSEVVERRLRSSDFLRSPGTPATNVQGYRNEFDKDPDSES